MRTNCYETILVQQKNAIRISNGRESVCHHKQGLVPNKAGSDWKIDFSAMLSNAEVGSSNTRMSGSLTSARQWKVAVFVLPIG